MKTTSSLSRLTAYAVIVAMLAGNVSPAYAQTDITINGSGSGSGDVWTSGSANTSYLHAYGGGDSENYTDWVQSPLNDRLWVTGGSLTTSGLYQNGKLYASGGNLNVSSGELHIASGSYINSGANLTLGPGAWLIQTGGEVTLNSGDSINNGYISATSGDLSFTGGTHTIKDGSNIANNFGVSGGTVTFANATSLNSNFSNSAEVAFNAGTLDNNVTGTGNTTFNNTVTNTGSVSQTAVTNNGALTNNGAISANLTNSNTIAGNGSITTKTGGTSSNNGTIAQNSLTNNGTFTSNGKITLTNGLTNNNIFNNNAMLLANVTNKSNATLSSDPDHLGKDVANNGTLNLNADGTLSVNVTGTGNTNISGNLENEGTISQNDVTVAAGKVVTTSASDITATHEINNSGVIDYTGGSTANTINGTGRIVVTGYVTNTGDINQTQVNNSSVFINNGNVTANLVNTGSLEGAGNYTTKTGLSSNSGVIEQANLTNKGTFDNNGHVDLTGTLTNDTNAVFNTDASLISAAGGLANAGTVNFMTGTNAVNMTGTGTTNFHNTTGNTASIEQNLVTNDGKLNNTGTITANLTNANEITGTGSIVTKTDGASTNNGTIKQANLTNNGTFESNGKITVTDTLTNNKTFNNNAEIAGNVTNASSATFANAADITGNVTNSGTFANAAGITGDVVNNSSATFTNTADITGNVANNGTFTNSGDIVASLGVFNTSTFTNATGATITGPFGNSGTVINDGTITGAITNTGTGIINSVATNLVGTIDNANILNIAGGTVQENITGSTGTMNITADLVNAKNITQATVNNSAQLDNTGVITAAINNAGTINSTATNLKGTIDNDGTLNLAGGTVQYDISSTNDTGITNITADLTNGVTIAQATVNNSANLTNNANAAINATTVTNDGTVTNGGTITATDIVNNGTISGKASNLVASNGIANTGTLVFNAAGDPGTSNISGTGDVQVTAATTLSGTNTYTGGTLINGVALTVAGQNNLSTGDVTFTNNGTLAVTGAGSLSNVLKGQAATDRITVDNANALTLATATGAAGDFYKDGAGTMTFGMASNGYTGNTHVAAGTLTGNTGNINNTVYGTSGTTVEFTDNTDAELNGINTAGTFLKSGTGVFNVQNNTFSADVANIDAGTFAVNRAITADTLNVNSGATLRGNGNITGTVHVNSGATLAPGNSIDTLTISGPLNLASGSTTAIEMNETSSDKIVVTGATNIASGANLTVANEGGRFFEWNSFDILESDGGVNGTFNYDGTIANFDTDRIDVALEQSGSKVTLTAKRKATNYEQTPTVALSRNAGQAAHAVDAISTGFGGDIANALLQLEKLGGLNPDGVTLINPNATLSSALLDLTGVLYANSALIPLFNAKTLQVYDRIAQRSGAEKKCVDCDNNLWVQYYNQHDKVFSSSNSPRFYNNTSGALVGYDRSLGDFLVGAYAGFGKNDLRQRDDSKMDVEDTTFGLYSGYTLGDWAFRGTLFAGTQNYHGKRYISFMDRKADAKYNGSNVGLDLEASYNIPVFSWMNVKPFAGWLNSYAHQQAFTEKDAGALNLHVNSHDQFNSQARLGVRVDGQIKNRLSWYGSVAVKQFVGGDYAKLRMDLGLPNTDMHIISAQLGRTSFGGQVGANYALTNNWSVFANVEGNINNKAANCFGNVGVAYTW